MPEPEPVRAVIEFRETPFSGKAVVVRRVIEEVQSPADARRKFWAKPVWSEETKKIEILKTTLE